MLDSYIVRHKQTQAAITAHAGHFVAPSLVMRAHCWTVTAKLSAATQRSRQEVVQFDGWVTWRDVILQAESSDASLHTWPTAIEQFLSSQESFYASFFNASIMSGAALLLPCCKKLRPPDMWRQGRQRWRVWWTPVRSSDWWRCCTVRSRTYGSKGERFKLGMSCEEVHRRWKWALLNLCFN